MSDEIVMIDGVSAARSGVGHLTSTVPAADEDLVDLAGECKSLESRLAEHRRLLLSEVAGDVTGQHWSLEQGRVAKRTYNDDKILSDLLSATETPDLLALLLMLRDKDVVRFQWQWSKLKRLLEDWQLGLRVKAGEVESGDEEMIGEVWTSRATLKPVLE